MKALIHLAPREDPSDSFGPLVLASVQALRQLPAAASVHVNAMLRLPDDPFGRQTPYRAAVELIGDQASSIEALAMELGRRVEDVTKLDASTLLIGEGVVFISCEPAPVRYQYLMRRNDQFDHASYLKRYREIHSEFGLKTPGILGYVQFHVDDGASERAARHCGMGVWDVDSVSELHLASVERFLGEIAGSSIGAEAAEDEAVFVDRPRSFDFCSSVDWHR